MARRLRFYFDYVSPYAYLASTQLGALAARQSVELEPIPVLFAAMLASTGARGPAEIPARREYMLHDVTRLARALGVPIAPPATHPFNPLAALRATHAVPGEQRGRLVEAIFRATWVEARRVDDPRVVAEIAAEHGFDGEALLARAATDEVKGALRAATDDVIRQGAFGVPTMMVDEQLFWGVDSLQLLERHLAGDDVTDTAELARWRAIVPSAVRRTGG
jgi:2-hydroxychromene-2-carboxylate isomerase